VPFFCSAVVSITLATLLLAEAIVPGDSDELNGPAGSGNTLSDGRDLLSVFLKYFRINITIHLVKNSNFAHKTKKGSSKNIW